MGGNEAKRMCNDVGEVWDRGYDHGRGVIADRLRKYEGKKSVWSDTEESESK